MARRSRKFSNGGKNYVWVAARIRQDISTVVQSDLIVTATDWSVGSAQRSATIIAMRGWLSFANEGILSTTMAMYIDVADADTPSLDPNDVDTYIEASIMWTHGMFKSAGAISGIVQLADRVIDVKAKRKITSGDNCRLITSASVVDEIQVFGIIRTLLLLNNS